MSRSYTVLPNESIVISHPRLTPSIGRVGAMIVQQIHYFTCQGKVTLHDHQRWVYYTIVQWANHLRVSTSTIKRAFKRLRQLGVVNVSKLKRLLNRSDQTNSYALNMPLLEALAAQSINTSKLSTATPKPRASVHGINSQDAVKNGSNTHGITVSPTPPRDQNDPMVTKRSYKSNKSNKSKDEEVNPEGKEKKRELVSPVLSSQMLSVWNERVMDAKGAPATVMSKELAKHLVACLNRKFDKNMDQWRRYCDLIASSPYMMGESFTINPLWCIRFSTIDRVQQGQLGVGIHQSTPSYTTACVEHANVRAINHIEGVDESDVCKRTREHILKAIGAVHYCTWFTNVTIHGPSGEYIRFSSDFVRHTVINRFGYLLDKTPLESL